ncbi:hypothetical protein BHE74_00047861 [Ensete ventricosum]|nr:hypothetical protein BHE74_00047861 [Ensete ventricosum]
MGADKGKKSKVTEAGAEGAEPEHIDGELVLSIEKLQEIQDELEKVFLSHPALGDLLSEKDQEVFKLLTMKDAIIFKFMRSLDVEDFKDMKTGYSITFDHIANGDAHKKKGNKRPFAEERLMLLLLTVLFLLYNF